MALKEMVPPGKMLIADRGYTSLNNLAENKILATPNDNDPLELKRFNERIKEYGILQKNYHHSRKKHSVAFDAICVLVQTKFENGDILFTI